MHVSSVRIIMRHELRRARSFSAGEQTEFINNSSNASVRKFNPKLVVEKLRTSFCCSPHELVAKLRRNTKHFRGHEGQLFYFFGEHTISLLVRSTQKYTVVECVNCIHGLQALVYLLYILLYKTASRACVVYSISCEDDPRQRG